MMVGAPASILYHELTQGQENTLKKSSWASKEKQLWRLLPAPLLELEGINEKLFIYCLHINPN